MGFKISYTQINFDFWCKYWFKSRSSNSINNVDEIPFRNIVTASSTCFVDKFLEKYSAYLFCFLIFNRKRATFKSLTNVTRKRWRRSKRPWKWRPSIRRWRKKRSVDIFTYYLLDILIVDISFTWHIYILLTWHTYCWHIYILFTWHIYILLTWHTYCYKLLLTLITYLHITDMTYLQSCMMWNDIVHHHHLTSVTPTSQQAWDVSC